MNRSLKPPWGRLGARNVQNPLWVAAGLVALIAMPHGMARAAEEPSQKGAPFQYEARGRRDPFVALVRDGRLVFPGAALQSRGGAHPTLNGILWDPDGQSIALLNDAEAKVGDTVDGYRVAEIRRDAVVLTNGGEPLVLQISFDQPPGGPSSGTTKGGEAR